jgi:hypothetical protein
MKRYGFLALLILVMMMVLSACVGSTTVLFDNQTICGTIRVELTNSQTNVTEYYDVPMGERLAIDVAPNINYLYVVDYTAAGVNEEGYECIAIHRGQVLVPPGASQLFNLTAVTPTPSNTP